MMYEYLLLAPGAKQLERWTCAGESQEPYKCNAVLSPLLCQYQ